MSSSRDDEALTKFLLSLSRGADGECEHPYTDRGNRELVPEGARKCPICSAVMQTDRTFGVAIDICEPHGTWLDKDELRFLLANPPGSEEKRRLIRRRDSDAREKKWVDRILSLLDLVK